MAPSPRRVQLALLLVSLLFGANYVFTKRVLDTVEPAAWVTFRIFAAMTLLVPLGLWLGRGRIPLRTLPGLVVAALLGVVLNQVLFTEGMARTTAAHSAVINACIPVWTLCLAALLRQERLTLLRVGAVLIALAGVGLLLRADELLTGGEPLSATQLLGDVLTLLNGISFALHLVLLRRVGANLDPFRTTAVMFVIAAATLPCYSAPTLTSGNATAALTPPVLWFALYGVLFATVLTYTLNTWALRHTQSSQVALWISVQPLVAAAIGPVFAEPWPDWRFFTALACVSFGLWLRTCAP